MKYLFSFVLMLSSSLFAAIVLDEPPVAISLDDEDCRECAIPSGKVYCLYEAHVNGNASQFLCVTDEVKCNSTALNVQQCYSSKIDFVKFKESSDIGEEMEYEGKCSPYPVSRERVVWREDGRPDLCEQDWMLPDEKPQDRKSYDKCENEKISQINTRICSMDDLLRKGILNQILTDYKLPLASEPEKIIDLASGIRDENVALFTKFRNDNDKLKYLDWHQKNIALASSYKKMIYGVNTSVRKLVDTLSKQLQANNVKLDELISKNLDDARAGAFGAGFEVEILKTMKTNCFSRSRGSADDLKMEVAIDPKLVPKTAENDYKSMEEYLTDINNVLGGQDAIINPEQKMQQENDEQMALSYVATKLCEGLSGSEEILKNLNLEKTSLFRQISELVGRHRAIFVTIESEFDAKMKRMREFDDVEKYEALNGEVGEFEKELRGCMVQFGRCNFTKTQLKGECGKNTPVVQKQVKARRQCEMRK